MTDSQESPVIESATAPNDTGEPPDWDSITREVNCSRCGYNLRMLTSPRCPECGLEFEWSQILEAAARHPFLFEHNWRRRPVRSWLGTIWHGMRPRRFWRQVSIHEPIHVGPLVFLFVTAPLWFLIVMTAASSVSFGCTQAIIWLDDRHSILHSRPLDIVWSIHRYSDGFVEGLWGHLDIPLIITGVCLGIQVLLLLFVVGLRQTLGRCRLRSVQVLRVMGNAAPSMVATSAMILFVGIATTIVSIEVFGVMSDEWFGWSCLALIAANVVYAVHAGLRIYLDLPRSFWIAAAGTITAALFTATCLVLYSLSFR